MLCTHSKAFTLASCLFFVIAFRAMLVPYRLIQAFHAYWNVLCSTQHLCIIEFRVLIYSQYMQGTTTKGELHKEEGFADCKAGQD